MDNKITKPRVISSLFWRLMEQGGTRLFQLAVQIVLARLLEPVHFGTIAIVSVFISFANTFIQSGMNTALIQKKDADNLDFSSVFYASLTLAAFFYLIIFVAARSIATYFREPELSRILQAIALTLFPGAINSIQYAYVSKKLLYKKYFYNSLISLLISGVAAIIAAIAGLGVWTLVIQSLTKAFTFSIIMWFTVKWRPSLQFSFARFKSLFSFGGKILVSNLLDKVSLEIRSLIIGRRYNAEALGYYNRGESIPKMLTGSLDGAIQSVMLPTMSNLQDDRKNLMRVVRRSIKTSSFLVFPAMIGLAAVAEPAITVVLGEKWLPSVQFLQVFCFASLMQPIHSANLQAINAVGRSDIFLKLAVIKNVIGLIILSISVPFGVYAIAAGQIVHAVFSAFINAWPNNNLFGYNAKDQFKDIMPALSIALAMGLIVYFIGYIDLTPPLLLIVQLISGAGIYFGLAKLFKLESMDYIKISIKEMISKRKNANS